MNNFERIKAMSIDEMAEFFYQGINCVVYGDIDCETCSMNGKFDSLCLYTTKDNINKEEAKQWLKQESEEE